MNAGQVAGNAAKRTRFFRWIGVLLILAAGGGAWAWWHARQAAPAGSGDTASTQGPRGRNGNARAPARPVPVQVAAIRRGELHEYLNSLGTVTAASSVIVHARVDGLLQRLNFKEGQMVKAGQVLAEIDPAPFQASLAQVEGQLAKDQALLANARRDLQRYKTLLAQDSTSQQQVDTTESLVRQYEGTVKADQGQVDSARLQLGYTRVVEPVSGRLGLRAVDAGNMVNTSDTSGIVTINQVQPINVVFTLTEIQLPMVLGALREGKSLPVEAWDRDQKQQLAGGRVDSMDNQIDQTTGTVKLRAVFANEDGSLFPNQFVNVRLLAKTHPDAVIAPSAALQRGRNGTFVYVVGAENRVRQTLVKTGAVDGLNIEITEGLKGGETVVIDGIDQLREGAEIEVANPAALLKEKPRGAGRNGRHPGASGPAREGSASGPTNESVNGPARRPRESAGGAAASGPQADETERAHRHPHDMEGQSAPAGGWPRHEGSRPAGADEQGRPASAHPAGQ